MIPLMEWWTPRFADTRRTDRADWPTQREITPDSPRLRPIRRTRWWEYHWVSKNAPKGIRTDKSYDGLMGGRFHLISPRLNKLWRSKHAPTIHPWLTTKSALFIGRFRAAVQLDSFGCNRVSQNWSHSGLKANQLSGRDCSQGSQSAAISILFLERESDFTDVWLQNNIWVSCQDSSPFPCNLMHRLHVKMCCTGAIWSNLLIKCSAKYLNWWRFC